MVYGQVAPKSSRNQSYVVRMPSYVPRNLVLFYNVLTCYFCIHLSRSLVSSSLRERDVLLVYRACFASSRFKARDTVAPDYTFLALVSSYCCLKIEIHYTHFFIYPCSTPDKISGCMTFGRLDCLPLNVAWPCVQDVLYMGFSNVLKTITSCHFVT